MGRKFAFLGIIKEPSSHVEVVHDETMAFLSDSVHDQKIQVSPSTSPLNRSVRSRSNWIRLPQLRGSPNKVAPLEIDNPVGLPKSPTDDLDNESFADSLPKSTPSRDALWKARLQILLASVLYGTSFPLTKILDDHIPLGPSLTLRFGLATLVTLPWLWEQPALDWKTSRPALVQGMQVGVWVSIGFLAQAIGIVTTKANKAAFFCSLYVIVVPFLDRLTGIALTKNQIFAAGMSVFGVALLSSSEGSISIEVGDVWSLIQPIAFGIGYWRTEHIITRYPTEVNRIATAELLSCFILSLVYALWSWSTSESNPTSTMKIIEWFSNPQIVIALLWSGIVTTAYSAYLEAAAMKIISASETTLLISTEPIWACLFAWILVGEQLDSVGMIGALCIMCACIVCLCS